jgi:hypothetical protein
VDELRLNVEVPEPPEESVTLDVVSDAARPPDDEVAVRVIVPVNPPRLVMLIVELPPAPTSMLTVDGFAVNEKSGTLTVTVAV